MFASVSLGNQTEEDIEKLREAHQKKLQKKKMKSMAADERKKMVIQSL